MPQRDHPACHHTNRRHHDPHAVGMIRESSSSAVLTFKIPYGLTSWKPCVTGDAGAAETRSGNKANADRMVLIMVA